MEKTLDQLEAGFKDGKEALKRVRADIRSTQSDLKKQKEALVRIDATQKYARDQLSYLRSTNECVSFEEYGNLKAMSEANVELQKNTTSDVARIERLLVSAQATAELIEANLKVLKAQIEDHDNVYFLEDYDEDLHEM